MAPRTVRWNEKTGNGWRQVQTGPNKGQWQKYRNFKPLGKPQRNIHWGSGLVKAISKSKQTMKRLDADRTARDQSRKTQSPTINKRVKVGRGSFKNIEVPNPAYKEKDSSPGGDRDQDQVINMNAPVVKNAIKEQEKLKISAEKRWANNLVGYMDSGGNYIGGPGTISTNESEIEDQNSKNAGIKEKPKETFEQETARISKSGHWTRTPLEHELDTSYKESEAYRRRKSQLEKKVNKAPFTNRVTSDKAKKEIAQIRKKEKNIGRGGTGSIFAPQTVT